MPKDYRETLIRLDHEAGSLEVWTEKSGLIQRLQRLGFVVDSAQAKGVWLRGHESQIRFKKPVNLQGNRATEAQLAALAKARAIRKNSAKPT